MKKAIIIYNSHTGITKKYAEAIESFIRNKNIEVRLLPISEYSSKVLMETDYLLLGCWTSGLFFFGQHPEKTWINFAQQLPQIAVPEVALFTTYKLATGSMFKNMKKHLRFNNGNIKLELKSRKGTLSDFDKDLLDNFLN
jgi:flavodoxin